jgi:hypothetical protein
MSYEDYARNIKEKARAARRDEVLATMRPLYDAARAHIMVDLKEHGLVEAIRRHEMRKLAIERTATETL